MAIETITEACDFIIRWSKETEDMSGAALPDMPMPEPIRKLNASLGRVWSLPLDDKAPLAGLFGAQDEIISPWTYSPKNGVTLIAHENQFTWHLGYRTENIDELLVQGDLQDDPAPEADYPDDVGYKIDWGTSNEGREEKLARIKSEFDVFMQRTDQWIARMPDPVWRPTSLSLERTIICTLLGNFVLSHGNISYQFDWPESATELLFPHSMYQGRGFWIDDAETLIVVEAGDYLVAYRDGSFE